VYAAGVCTNVTGLSAIRNAFVTRIEAKWSRALRCDGGPGLPALRSIDVDHFANTFETGSGNIVHDERLRLMYYVLV
jgi:hypothetical protein